MQPFQKMKMLLLDRVQFGCEARSSLQGVPKVSINVFPIHNVAARKADQLHGLRLLLLLAHTHTYTFKNRSFTQPHIQHFLEVFGKYTSQSSTASSVPVRNGTIVSGLLGNCSSKLLLGPQQEGAVGLSHISHGCVQVGLVHSGDQS